MQIILKNVPGPNERDPSIAYRFVLTLFVLLGEQEMLMRSYWLACPCCEPQELPVTQRNITPQTLERTLAAVHQKKIILI